MVQYMELSSGLCFPPASESADICLEQAERIADTVLMAALVAMGGVHAGTNQGMTDIMAGTQGGFHIGAVVWIYIHRIANPMFPCKLHQPADNIVIIRPSAVLGAD